MRPSSDILLAILVKSVKGDTRQLDSHTLKWIMERLSDPKFGYKQDRVNPLDSIHKFPIVR